MMKSSVLLLVDFINDIVHPEGKLKSCVEQCAKRNPMEKANEAAVTARFHSIPVIHVKIGFDENYQAHPEHSPYFGKAKAYKALMLGGWGTEFHEKIVVKPEDSVVIKSRVSAFYATRLETFLRARNVEHIFIAGVSTTWGVQSTVRDAHDRDYSVSILENACADRTGEGHTVAIDTLSAIANITSVESMKTLLS